jgi:penicillin-insensitive murein endopeptidase
MRPLHLAAFGLLLIAGTAHGEESATKTTLATNILAQSEATQSVSCGSTNRGALGNPAMLPMRGPGFIMAEPWRSRGSSFGTAELVSLIQRSSWAVALAHEGSQLSVADLSNKQGGAIAQHRSHQNGRDVDLIYYAMDKEGNPFYPDSHMAYYTSEGQATYAKAPNFAKNIPIRYFDLKRNWSLIRHLMLDTEVEVEFIFVSGRVKRWLLRYATELEESQELIKKVTRLLHVPKGTGGHNDHMHVRITCSADDIEEGRCRTASARKPRRASKWHRIMACPAGAALEAPPVAKRKSKKKSRSKKKSKKRSKIARPQLPDLDPDFELD